MEFIRAGKTPGYPKGMACKMLQAIKDKIQKQDTITAIELETDIAAMSMKRDENPKVSFDQTSAIKFKYERDDDPSTNTPEAKFIPRTVMAVANQCKSVTASTTSRKKRKCCCDPRRIKR